MMQISTIIFDYDGVLANNYRFNFLACQKAAAGGGMLLTEKEYLNYFYPGQTLHEGAKSFLSDKKQLGFLSKFIELKRNQDPLYDQAVEPITGAIEFVTWASSLGFTLAIGSGARRVLITKFLTKYNLSQKFSKIISADDVINSKPNPETYLKVLESLNILPETAVVIEDSVAGILAAKSAKCRVIGLASTAPAKKLFQADGVAENYSEILAIVNQLD